VWKNANRLGVSGTGHSAEARLEPKKEREIKISEFQPFIRKELVKVAEGNGDREKKRPGRFV